MTDKLLKFIKEHLIFLILLCLIPLVYSNILHSPLVFDSQSIDLQKNLKELKILNISYRHITNLSFALNNYLGAGITGNHLLNVILHTLNTILFYYLSILTLKLQSLQNQTEKLRLIPLLAATFFALHPIQTSAVTYVIQRATVLATFFCLLSMVFYIWGSLNQNKRVSFFLFYPASLVFLMSGLISKEQAILFPLIILLYDIFFLSEFRWKRLILKLTPIVGIFVLTGFIAIVKLHAFEAVKQITSIFINYNTPIPFNGWTAVDVFWTPAQHIMTGFRVVSRYLSIFVLPFPSRMVFDFGPNYPVSTGLLTPVSTLISLFFLSSLLIISIRYAKKYPLFSFGILFYLIAISLESFVAVGSDLYFEHRNYLPSIGIFLSLSFVTAHLIQRISLKKAWYLLIIIMLLLSYATYNRNSVWHSRESLWLDTLKKAPNNKRAMTYLGQEYIYKRKYRKALDILLKSLEIEIPTKSFDLIANSNLLKVYSDTGKKKESADTLHLMEKLSSNKSRLSLTAGAIYYILGNAYFTYGDIEKSEEYLIRSLSFIYSRWYRFPAYVLLGQVELRQGKFQQAQSHIEKAKSLRPDSPIPLLHLGDLYYAQKDVKRAEEFYRSALKINPRYFKVYIQLGQLYMALKKYPSAKEALEKALEFRPDEYRLLVSLGNISFLQRNMDSSIMYFSRALEIRPDNPTNYFNLGECYARKGDTANAKKYFLQFLELAHGKKFKAAKDKAGKWLKKITAVNINEFIK